MDDDIGMFDVEEKLSCPICDDEGISYRTKVIGVMETVDKFIDEDSVYVDENNCNIMHNDVPRVTIFECERHGLKLSQWKKCKVCGYQKSEDVIEKMYDLK